MVRLRGQQKIAILIATDDSYTSYSLRKLLASQKDLLIVDVVTDSVKAVHSALELKPDVIVVDFPASKVNLPDMIMKIHVKAPTAKFILLATEDNIDYFMAACKAGVKGYLLKTKDIKQIVQAIKAVSLGSMIVEPSLLEFALTHLVYRRARNSQAYARDELTRRELEVLRLAAKGCSNKQIALQLDLSEATVKGHLSRLLSKLNVLNRTEAVFLATKQKLISLDDA